MRQPPSSRVTVTDRCRPSEALEALDEDDDPNPLLDDRAEAWADALDPDLVADEAMALLAPCSSSATMDVSTRPFANI